MPLAGLVLNRVHPGAARAVGAERAPGRQREDRDATTTTGLGLAGLLRLHADLCRWRRAAAQARAHAGSPPATPARRSSRYRRLAEDVHDLDGLRRSATWRQLSAADSGRRRTRLAEGRPAGLTRGQGAPRTAGSEHLGLASEVDRRAVG